MNRYLFLPLLVFAVAYGEPPPPPERNPVPVSVPASLWTASINAEMNQQYDEALAKILEFGKQGGDHYLVTLRAAWLYYLKADYTNAAAAYANASHLQPSAVTPLLGALNTAIAQADATKITKAAEAVMKVDASNYKAQMVLAEGAYLSLDYRRAYSIYRRVLTFYPEDMTAISGAAWSAFNLGEKKEAQDAFKKITSMNPGYPDAQRGYELSAGIAPSPPVKPARPAN